MNNQLLTHIGTKWFAAFNNHNLDELLSLYDDKACHYSPKLKIRKPETNGLITGKEALRQWWKDSFDRIPTLKYEIIRFTPYEDRIFMEYTRHADGDEDFTVAEVLEIKNGLIVFSKVYHG